jgi:hypothetical protein
MDEGACAPSENEIKMDMTLKRVEAALMEAIINLDVWRVFGANRSPSEFVKKMYLTINHQSLLHEMFRMYSTPSQYGFKNRLTINWTSTIEVEAMDGNVNVPKAMHEPFLLGTDILINWKIGCVSMLRLNVNATINCQIDAIIIGTWSCKELSIAGLSFRTGRCFAGLSIVGPFENSFVMDATTNLNMEEDLSLKDKALLFEMDAATNLNVAEDLSQLIWFVEVAHSHTNDAKVLHKTYVMKVMGSHVNNAKRLHETFFVEVTDSNPVWEQTQQ